MYNGLGLSDRKIGKICKINHKIIGNYRRKFKITTRKPKEIYIDGEGYVRLLMSKDYRHPISNPEGKKRIQKREHTIVMERYLAQRPDSKLAKECLIEGKFLKPTCEVHHINQKRHDNRLENLWLYPDKSSHAQLERNLNDCFMVLIKLNQILFRNGTYYINQDLDYKNLRSEIINKAFEYTKVQTWENIEEIRQEIKKVDWTKFSVNWDLEHEGWNNQFGKRESGRVERIINDTRFNMTDLRFAELCNISESTAYSWRWEKFNIPTLNRGQYRLIVDNEIHRGVFIKLPDSYNNPYATEKVNSNVMPEHRYIIERYFSQKIISQKYSEYLLDNKYLKPEYDVHHINLDPFDNRIENLWVTDDHNGIHANLRSLVQPLMEYNYLFFGGGEYFLYSTKC